VPKGIGKSMGGGFGGGMKKQTFGRSGSFRTKPAGSTPPVQKVPAAKPQAPVQKPKPAFTKPADTDHIQTKTPPQSTETIGTQPARTSCISCSLIAFGLPLAVVVAALAMIN
jgi:hypothetical protein